MLLVIAWPDKFSDASSATSLGLQARFKLGISSRRELAYASRENRRILPVVWARPLPLLESESPGEHRRLSDSRRARSMDKQTGGKNRERGTVSSLRVDRSISLDISPRCQSSPPRRLCALALPESCVSARERSPLSLSLRGCTCKNASIVVPINSPYSHSTTRRAARDCRSSVARRLVLSCAARTFTFYPFLSTPVVNCDGR